MDVGYLDRCALALNPTISLRDQSDGKAVIRFLNGVAPPHRGELHRYIVLIKENDQTSIQTLYLGVSESEVVAVLEYLIHRIQSESTRVIEVEAFGKDFDFHYVNESTYIWTLGDRLAATVVVDKDGECKIRTEPGMDVACVEIERLNDSVDLRSITLRREIQAAFNLLTDEERIKFKRGINCTGGFIEHLNQAIGSQLQYWLDCIMQIRIHSVKVKVYDLKIDNDLHVYLTEERGHEEYVVNMSRSTWVGIADPYTVKLVYVTLDPKCSVVTEQFLVGFLRNLLINCKTYAEFNDRFRFVNFDAYVNQLQGALTKLKSELFN